MDPNAASTVDVLAPVFVTWPKITLLKVLSWNVHCYYAASTCLDNDFAFLDKCAMINILKLC
jgi:hypothetical protein